MAHPTGRPESYWNQFEPEPGPNDPPPSTWLPRGGARQSAASSPHSARQNLTAMGKKWIRAFTVLFLASLVTTVAAAVGLWVVLQSTESVKDSTWGIALALTLLFTTPLTCGAALAVIHLWIIKRKWRDRSSSLDES